MSIIIKQDQLQDLCQEIKKCKLIAIDIEFMRSRTFYPILCLIQVDVPNIGGFIIDALSNQINLKPFAKILKSSKVTKVLHCATQDLSVILHELKVAPKSVIDTQLMANFLGYNFNISYANLVSQLLDKELNKEQQRSDWQKRPLSEQQIAYALNDVKYLIKIYQILEQKLVKQGKLKYFLIEMKSCLDKRKYNINKQDLFKKFNLDNKTVQYQRNLKNLVLWRDKLAKAKNIPRTFILKDNIVSDIAKRSPDNFEKLKKIFKANNIRKYHFSDEILAILKKEKLKSAKGKKIDFVDNRLSEKQKNIYKLAQDLLEKKSQDFEIVPQLIISQNNLKKIILKKIKLKTILDNWRYQIFGKELKNLIKK